MAPPAPGGRDDGFDGDDFDLGLLDSDRLQQE
jgi:hypothetical protein